MDGNGRWAAQHGLERFEGHIRGVESVRRAIQAATRHGVRYLTLYAFSTENWGRPAAEVDALMELFCKSIINETPELAAQGVRVRIIGDKSRFPEKVKHHLDQIENRTATGKRLTLQLALNYSSRSEIVHAMQGLARRAAAGIFSPEEISEQTVSEALYTAGCPDPPAANNGSAISCCGRLPTPNSFSPPYYGPTLPKRISRRHSTNMPGAKGVSDW